MSPSDALDVGLAIGSFLLLAKAADRLVEATLSIAAKLRISPAAAGVTISAPATSAPELGTALMDVLSSGGVARGSVGLGTIMGSAAFNLAAIVGVVGLVSQRRVGRRVVLREGVSYAAAVLALVVCITAVSAGVIGMLEALLLMAAYTVYVAVTLSSRDDAEDEPFETSLRPARALLELVVSIAVIGVACHFLIQGTETVVLKLSPGLGIEPDNLATLVSVVVVAIGTSVPDLFASLQAARRGQVPMAVSNAIGSNTFDILVCIGLPYALVGGHEVNDASAPTSLLLLGLAFLVTTLLLFRDPPRRAGAIGLLGLYATFVAGSLIAVLT